MAIKRLLSCFGFDVNRPNVLIFGASGGGRTQFKKIGKSHNVIGFVDNDSSKRGTYIEKKPVYSPQDITCLAFDKLIIASCYYKEITKQLVDEIQVDPEKISVFHFDEKSKNIVWTNIGQLVSQRYFRVLLGITNPYFVKLGFSLVQRTNRSYRSVKLTPIHWIDEQTDNVDAILLPESQAVIYGPKFTGNLQPQITVNLPAIVLSRYESATIMCTSNTLLCNEQLLMWRSPTSDNRFSDYSGEVVINHGTRYALTKDIDSDYIEKGIAITGSVDVNYFHWMLEVVSKLAYLDKVDSEYDQYPIVISEKARDIEAISSFIKHLELKRRFIYIPTGKYFEIGDLLTITPPNFVVTNFKGKTQYEIKDCYFTYSSLQFLRQHALSYLASQSVESDKSERIFLARKGVLRPYNQEEVWEILKARSFDIIYLEDLTFVQQLDVMQQANYIVGPTGAAWTNLIFCEPYTKALCWMAEEYGDLACFSHLAAAGQVDMEYISYKTGSENSSELLFSSYEVDVQKVVSWLDTNHIY